MMALDTQHTCFANFGSLIPLDGEDTVHVRGALSSLQVLSQW